MLLAICNTQTIAYSNCNST